MKKTVYIEGMSCAHCAARVKKALEALPEVSGAEVDLEGKKAVITGGVPNDAVIREAVEDAGYSVVSIE